MLCQEISHIIPAYTSSIASALPFHLTVIAITYNPEYQQRPVNPEFNVGQNLPSLGARKAQTRIKHSISTTTHLPRTLETNVKHIGDPNPQTPTNPPIGIGSFWLVGFHRGSWCIPRTYPWCFIWVPSTQSSLMARTMGVQYIPLVVLAMKDIHSERYTRVVV